MNTAWKRLWLFGVLAAAWSVACTDGKPSAREPEARSQALYENVIWESVAQIEVLCETHLVAAAVLRDRLVSGAKPGWLETLQLMNQLEVEVDQVLYPSELYANVHPDEGVRGAAEKCNQRASAFMSALKLNRELYDVLARVRVADPTAVRYLEHTLRDYRRAGVHKDPATRRRLAAILDELVVAGQKFMKNIRDDRRTIEVSVDELAGMPEDFIEARQQEGKQTLILSTDRADYLTTLKYAENEEVRHRMFLEFSNRAYPANELFLWKILALRHEYATLLGYKNWADYNAEDKMIGSGDAIAEFIHKVADLTRDRAALEKTEMNARKRRDVPEGATAEIQYWDRFYYTGKIREERFGVDAQVVRQYFPYQRVLEGLLEVHQEMFGVTFRKLAEPQTWHESVLAYDVIDAGEVRGRFFLDMHPRAGKFKHGAMFPIHSGVTGMQAPTASLVCNFEAPTANTPGLMEHREVKNLFHEFGHLVHHVLAARHDWHRFSGTATEWDFVEAPSQVMEEWAWNAEILRRFGRHFETDEPIPTELVVKMRAADEFGKGIYVMRQLFLAALSYRYHVADPASLRLADTLRAAEADFSPYPEAEGNHFYTSFGHLNDYDSTYYTYMWSLMIAKDIFSRFEAEGMNNPDVARDYREKIIEPGGSKDAKDLGRDFLGRDYSFEAFRKWLES